MSSSRALRPSDLHETLGTGALFVFAAFAWLGTGIAHIALGIMAALILIDRGPARQHLARDPLARLGAVFTAYVVLAAWLAARRWPATAAEQWASLWPWVSLWTAPIVAWWFAARQRRVWMAFALAALGLLIAIARRADVEHLRLALSGERYEFGFTALGISFLSLMIIVGTLCFMPRLVAAARDDRLARVWLGLALALQLIFLFVLFAAQSRGALISLGFALLLVAGFGLLGHRGARPGARLRAGLAAPLVSMGALLLILANSDFGRAMSARFSEEIGLIPQALSGDIDALPYSSGASRLHLAAWGTRLFLDRPVIGWGPGTSATRFIPDLLHPDRPASGFLGVIEHFAHLHDAYMEIAVRFGLIGIMAFGAGLVIIWRGLARSARSRAMPPDLAVFGRVAILTTLFFSAFEFRLLHTDFRFFALLFAGAIYSFVLHPSASNGRDGPRDDTRLEAQTAGSRA